MNNIFCQTSVGCLQCIRPMTEMPMFIYLLRIYFLWIAKPMTEQYTFYLYFMAPFSNFLPKILGCINTLILAYAQFFEKQNAQFNPWNAHLSLPPFQHVSIKNTILLRPFFFFPSKFVHTLLITIYTFLLVPIVHITQYI